MYPKTVEFRINLEKKGNVRIVMLRLEYLNPTNIYSMLDNKHGSKSEFEINELLKKAINQQESKQEEYRSAYESLKEMGENHDMVSFADAYHALIETANSISFCSIKRAKIRKFKQRLRLHQLRLEANSWVIQYCHEKLKVFKTSKMRLLCN